MNNRTTKRDDTAGTRRPVKTTKGPAAQRAAAKRAAARREAAQRLAARRRRQRTLGGLAVVAAIGLVVAIVLYWGDDSTPADQAAPDTSQSQAAADGSPAFPPLPAGADPALATRPSVGAGSGALTKLTVTTLIEGKGEPTRAGQQITVNYVGVSYTTGKEFDASWKRSQPFSFALGQGRVIKGWDQGLVGVKVGSRVQLDIPADLAYGDNAGGGTPSGPLRFVVDVLAAQ